MLLGSEEVLELDLPPDLSIDEMATALQTLPAEEWPADLHLLCTEIHVIQEELSSDAPFETAGGVSAASPDDDVGLRLDSLDAMADESAKTFRDHDGEEELDPDENVPASGSTQECPKNPS